MRPQQRVPLRFTLGFSPVTPSTYLRKISWYHLIEVRSITLNTYARSGPSDGVMSGLLLPLKAVKKLGQMDTCPRELESRSRLVNFLVARWQGNFNPQ